MNAARFAYTLMLYALLPRALLHLWWRARRQPAYRAHLAERFGHYGASAPPPLIWVHAVSVGETRAAAPLIAELQRQYPRHRILLTHMTPTGRETGVALYGDSVQRAYLPYDFPYAVARFLDHFKPVCGILLETEIWPNLIHACRLRKLPVYLLNARMSEKSRRRYARFRALATTSLNELTAIIAQSPADAERLRSLGAKSVAVTGNLKFDITPDPALVARGLRWREHWGSARPVLLCASTREGEEAILLEALRQLDMPDLLTVIVPRHPQRFDDVAALIARAGFAYQRRSADAPITAQTRILIGDSMGEMFAYYAASDVAIIGGSLLPFGAQNLIEACAAGCPVVVGPHTYNFAEVVQLALAAGAAVRVETAPAAIAAARELLLDPARARRMGQAGLAFTCEHRGAAVKAVGLLKF